MSGKVNKEGLSIEEAAGEPRQGCLSSLASQTKGGFGDRFRGLAWDKLPAAHCLGAEETRDCEERSVGRGREREWHWPLPRGRALGPLSGGFFLSQAGILGEVSGEGSVGYSPVVQVCPFRVMVSTDWSGQEHRVIGLCSWSLCLPPGFAAFLKYN